MGLSNGIAPVRKTARTVRNVYRRARDLARAGGANDSSDEATQWVRCYRSAKLDPAMVLYQTHSGASMSCNPYAIFRALLDDPEFAHLKHVWVLDSYAEIGLRSAEYAGHPNVTFVRFKTREYLEALASAGYLIQNTTFPSYFTKRPGQVYVNTWHSAGAVKKMGFDLPQGNYVSRNVLRDLMMADFIVAPNALMARMYAESFRLRGLYRGTILDFGYPRNDVTLNTPPAGVLDELRQRGVRVDPAKKVILYAPTWRGTIGNVRAGVDELEQFRATLAERIDSDDYQIPIKPHLYHYNQLTGEQRLSGQYIPRHFNTNGLLAAVDILVSDYSSIFFDFVVTGRPILFFVPDLVEYTRERGLYFAPDELPGPVTDDPAVIADGSTTSTPRWMRMPSATPACGRWPAPTRTVDRPGGRSTRCSVAGVSRVSATGRSSRTGNGCCSTPPTWTPTAPRRRCSPWWVPSIAPATTSASPASGTAERAATISSGSRTRGCSSGWAGRR